MLTEQTQDYEFNLDDKASVIELLTKQLTNPDFFKFNLFISQKWESNRAFTNIPKRHYSVSVGTKFKNATNN